MATRKKSAPKKPSTSVENTEITPEQVWDVLKFAQSIYNGGVYTPQLVNAVMQNITMNPAAATSEKINTALADPKNSEQQLIGYSEFEELTSMVYKRVLYYFGGLLEFNWSYTCINAEEKDYTGKPYQKDLKIVEDFFDKFNPKQEFRNVIKELMRQEAFFGIFRDDGNYAYTIQELPQNQCLITGRWELGLLFDFNMIFFLSQAGVDINLFPSVFKRLFNRAFGDKQGTNMYDPANSIDYRTGNWTYWVQTSPKDNFWCFKLIPEQASRVPFLSPFLKDVVLQDMIRALQNNSYIASASKLLAGGVPFLKDTKASVKDSISLAPETLGKFLQLIKSGLSDVIKVVAAPLDNISGVEFAGNNDLYNSYLKTTASVSGVNSRLLFTTDRQNLLETKLSMDVDINVLRPVLTQFNNFLNFFVNQRTKKFKFKFEVGDFNTTIDRDERIANVKTFTESGIVLDQMIARSIGMNIFDFRRQMAETKANSFVERLTPVLKASQSSAGANGRPPVSDNKLSESGSETQAAGSNEEKQIGN